MRVFLTRALTVLWSFSLLGELFRALDGITRRCLGEELQPRGRLRRVLAAHSVVDAVLIAARARARSSRSGRLLVEIEVPIGYARSNGLRFNVASGQVARSVFDAPWESFA
jgi:NitT/TauT family transport system ATP-binding protein